jgi:NifU-like protein involved in Fe-S cluster formation
VKYNEATLRYFQGAAGAGVLGPGAARGQAGDRNHGTWVQFDFETAGGVVTAASFLAFACPHTIAVAAWLVEQVIGAAAHPKLPCSIEELSERFAVPVEKRGRLLLLEDAWSGALAAALRPADSLT